MWSGSVVYVLGAEDVVKNILGKQGTFNVDEETSTHSGPLYKNALR